jgi:hypothetical protein
MRDSELIDKVAELWVELGGDSIGIAYSWPLLQKAVKRLEEKDNV